MRKSVIALMLSVLVLPAGFLPAEAQEKGLIFYGIQFEEMEYRFGDESERLFGFDGDAFIGTDELKLRWLGKGEYSFRDNGFEKLENRVVLQKPVSDFFDVKAGFRLDTPEGRDRWYGVLGLAGLAPQWFETDLDLFVSEKGRLSTRLDLEYELLLTNRLILTPSINIDAAFSDDRDIGIGKGVTAIEAGLRLGYDLVDRTISPYVGVVYEGAAGKTADLRREAGSDVDGWRTVIGTRLMF
ncbi:MAG: copper resistance protein B [Rhodospirillales bacterium]